MCRLELFREESAHERATRKAHQAARGHMEVAVAGAGTVSPGFKGALVLLMIAVVLIALYAAGVI